MSGAAPFRRPGTPRPLTLAAAEAAARPPRLSFLTTALPPGALDGAELLDLLTGRDDVVSWVHEGRGLVGLGRALVLGARGAGRIEELRRAWRATVYASWWRDPLVRPGTGPVAVGTIAFSDRSAAESVLLVPEVIVGADESGAWMTTAVRAPVGGAPGAGGAPAEHPDHGALLAELLETASAAPEAGADRGRALVELGALDEADWRAAVDVTRERMRAGEARKVVLARDVLVTPGQALPTGTILGRLGRAYPSCWTFAVDGMLGASPEMLLRLAGRRLTSRVLAGTARRHPSDTPSRTAELAAWLEGSEKNNREHALARASAIEALMPLCSVVEAPERFLLELPNVLHLASDITGVVAGDTGALSLVGALHPTAAVCGTPRGAAGRIIEEVEGMDRGRYAGPVGWVDWHGEGEWCIALRSGSIAAPGGPVRVFGGGGIMPDSDPDDELAETRAKMRPMLGALGALPIAETGRK
ncbi:isochorismate synthase [Actinomyces marmotae]|uniref:isochorismate synthase n=1 Tax=Actinomyces marmotae TaxID=2737173 RepID=A0A6M8B388_9ACTO|nr:isochorismate synthase [Actinomyces marmotae]QKD79127.1 chorismate-binding protein [Actinomyces marmotae]